MPTTALQNWFRRRLTNNAVWQSQKGRHRPVPWRHFSLSLSLSLSLVLSFLRISSSLAFQVRNSHSYLLLVISWNDNGSYVLSKQICFSPDTASSNNLLRPSTARVRIVLLSILTECWMKCQRREGKRQTEREGGRELPATLKKIPHKNISASQRLLAVQFFQEVGSGPRMCVSRQIARARWSMFPGHVHLQFIRSVCHRRRP